MPLGDPHIPIVPVLPESAPRVRLIPRGAGEGTRPIPLTRIVNLIGSRQGCKVILKHRAIAPVHLALVYTGKGYLAVDLVTRQGSRLNDLKLAMEPVSDGDVLGLPPWNFEVRVEPSLEAPAVDAHPFDLEPTPQLIALEHGASGRILQPHREVCVIGRREGCDITVGDRTVSRVHALLIQYFGYPAVFDLLSQNGTFVNDERVGFQMLKHGDVVAVGEVRFRMHLRVLGALDRSVKNTPVQLPRSKPADSAIDLVDIAEAEGSQTWAIVDQLAKASAKE